MKNITNLNITILDGIKFYYWFHFIILASPQLTVNADPNALVLGAVVAGVGGLALNHAAGDPLGKHLGNLFNRKPKNQFSGNRPPTNVEHHHHHYIPEYDTQEGMFKVIGINQNMLM